MKDNELLREIRQIRDKMAAEYGNDPEKYFAARRKIGIPKGAVPGPIPGSYRATAEQLMEQAEKFRKLAARNAPKASSPKRLPRTRNSKKAPAAFRSSGNTKV